MTTDSKPTIRVIQPSEVTHKVQASEWELVGQTPNVKVFDDNGKFVTSLHEKRINDVPEAKEIHETIKSVYKLIVVVIPLMFACFVYEALYIRDMSFLEIINRMMSIYLCIGASFQLRDSINNRPFDPLLVFTWINKKFFSKISKKILALKNQ